ncbi:gamma carbonic anhydrase family protein [Rhodococcus sp. 06-418-1B]|nr:gamma carbonic anhydrase family protein [Rhodococcus sp. 06-418-1B]OZC85303.1 gamma carbonic anhydrase family protein [Rhodococcus sp. 06-418-1B]
MIVHLDGMQVETDDSAWVAPTAVVIGRVTLGSEVGVWYGSVIRADDETIRIGDRTNIQDGCVLHADPGFPLAVGTGVSLGHNAVLHGCTIGDDVLIGMGAIVMNGAVVGQGSLVAAGAVVTAGAVVPSGSLVAGIPGKVRRSLTSDEIEGNRANARSYVDNVARHRAARTL